MSTNLTCFLFGIPFSIIWAYGLKRGMMAGRKTRWVRRTEEPITFWVMASFYGSIALGFLIAPVLSWLGLRG